MTPTWLRESADTMAAELGGEGRVWIIGLTRLVDAEDDPPVDVGVVEQLIADARELGFYPQGRASYLGNAPSKMEVAPAHRAVALRFSTSGSPDHVGVVAVGHGNHIGVGESFESGDATDPSGVLLSDVEATMADLLVLAYVRALQVDYRGKVELVVRLSDIGVPGGSVLWRLDKATGKPVPTGRRVEDFGYVGYAVNTTDTFEHLYETLRHACTDAARRFGADGPEWMPRPEHDELAYQYRDRHTALEARGITARHEAEETAART